MEPVSSKHVIVEAAWNSRDQWIWILDPTLILPELCDMCHSSHQRVSKCGPQTTASASLANLLELQILRPLPNPPESETLRMGLAIGASTNPPGDSVRMPAQV